MSPRTGRPKLEKPNLKNLTVRISTDLSQRLDEFCEANNMSKGEVVRVGIEKVLSKKKK